MDWNCFVPINAGHDPLSLFYITALYPNWKMSCRWNSLFDEQTAHFIKCMIYIPQLINIPWCHCLTMRNCDLICRGVFVCVCVRVHASVCAWLLYPACIGAEFYSMVMTFWICFEMISVHAMRKWRLQFYHLFLCTKDMLPTL